MTIHNPFTERSRIVEASRFAGRWRELSIIFDAIESRRPVLVTGPPGIGKSSLLTHIVASAAVNLEEPSLATFYLALHEQATPDDVYHTVLQALSEPGTTAAALEVALLQLDIPVLLCLDDVHRAFAAGWGGLLLDTLARIARDGLLILVAALEGDAPLTGERFAVVRLGAFAPSEVRLLAESYLEGTDVIFTPSELRALTDVSAGHPAYLQRAAYHLFESRRNGGDWRARFLADVRNRPVPGAPLPPAAFEGEGEDEMMRPGAVTSSVTGLQRDPAHLPLPELPRGLLLLVAPMAAMLLFLATGNMTGAFLLAAFGCVVTAAWLYRRNIS